jgi:hypothetical protein
MRLPTALELVELWDYPASGNPHARLAPLVEALFGEVAREDTLGTRNLRLIELHERLFGTRMEAVITCVECGTDVELEVPMASIRTLPPATVREISISYAGAPLRYRLPVMADLEAVAAEGLPESAMRRLLERCRYDSVPESLQPDEAALAVVAEAFDTLDPAAALSLESRCPGCGAIQQARLDLAGFLLRDMEHAISALTREVDHLARAYGWSEAEILRLPQTRRRRYIERSAAAANVRAVS